MKRHWPLAAAAVLVLVTADSALAKQHRHRARVPAGPAAVDVHPSFGPARMIEARPGVFISNYDCITDDGYGRWRPCSDKK
jgi:hypothetical protein